MGTDRGQSPGDKQAISVLLLARTLKGIPGGKLPLKCCEAPPVPRAPHTWLGVVWAVGSVGSTTEMRDIEGTSLCLLASGSACQVDFLCSCYKLGFLRHVLSCPPARGQGGWEMGVGKGERDFTGKPFLATNDHELLRPPWGRVSTGNRTIFNLRSVLFLFLLYKNTHEGYDGVGMNPVTPNPNIYIPGDLVPLPGLLDQVPACTQERMPCPSRAGVGWGLRRAVP